MTKGIITINPEILSGTPVFSGTRVPVQNLFDCLEEGYTIGEFLDDFPSVQKSQAIGVLEGAKEKIPAIAAG